MVFKFPTSQSDQASLGGPGKTIQSMKASPYNSSDLKDLLPASPAIRAFLADISFNVAAKAHQHNLNLTLKNKKICMFTACKVCFFTQNVVKLIQVMLPRKDWPVGQHLSQDAAH